jgi:signal transduction histidine kinase/ligand-binding sensor domain-containing protein
MSQTGNPKFVSALAVCLFLFIPVLAGFIAQDPEPTPDALPQISPTASVSPTPPPTPTPTPLPGAQNFHQWGSITVFNGLPSDSVRAIAQTPDGVMWFGTDNGLARFDGRRIQNFSLGEADANRILVLKTSETGELWIGTRSGAFVYSDSVFLPIESAQNISITAILLDTDGYLGTDDGRILRVRRAENGRPTAENVLADPIKSAAGEPIGITSLIQYQGSLLAGTSGRGVFVIDNGAAREFQTSPRPLFVNSLAGGSLWMGTDAAKGMSGVYLDRDDSKAVRITAPTARVLTLEENSGELWAGTERYGLFHISDSKLSKIYTFVNTSGGLRSDTIYSLFTDREGVLWIGTNRGVCRFDRMAPFQQTVSDIPNSNFIRSLYVDQVTSADSAQQIYLAGSNRGLFQLNGDKWEKVPALRDKVIYAIGTQGTASRSGDLRSVIVGTPEGVFNISGKQLIKGDSRAIRTIRDRTYVAVYGQGVIDISGNSPKIVFSDPTVTSLGGFADKLWIGTVGNGLFSFDGNTTKVEFGPDTLKIGTIWSIYETGDQAGLWIGAQHGVFYILNGKPEQIVAAEDVRDVWAGADGQVWAATTTRGLLHARYDERFGWLLSSMGFEQGLPSEKAFVFMPAGDDFLVGTNRGIVKFQPYKVPPKLIPTRVLSQRVHDLGELNSTIALDYPQNSLLVEVAGQSSRTFPEEFQYAFTLKNGRGNVLDTRLSNDAQYTPTDLKPGEYSIEAIAINRDLLLSDPLVIRFSVAKAPFPLTATALAVLLVLALAGLVWAFIEHRRIVHRNRELAAARLDLANEAERERRRIARDLHDQTLADLRNLMMTSDEIAPGNVKFRSEVEAVSSEIRRICEDLSPSVLENVGLVASLEFLLDRTIGNKKFTADPDLEDRITFPINVQLQVYRIAQEILTNIKRHSNADLVEMAIAIDETGEFLMTIRDNGTSFQPDGDVNNGRGIPNIKARASMINAQAKWQEPKSGGNSFSLRISAENVQGDR